MATANTELRPSKKLKCESTRLPQPIAVLDDQYYGDVESVDVYVATVTDKSRIRGVLQQLKTALPLPSTLGHLKRVRGDQIILAAVDGVAESDCVSAVAANRLEGVLPTIAVCAVPRHPPKTKRQHAEANALWPCNFHPSKMVEDLLAQRYFVEDEVRRQREYMRLALDAALERGSAAAAVVVNPRTEQVMAVGVDERSRNPSGHAVMAALEKVAESQRSLFRAGADGDAEMTVDAGEERRQTDEELPYLCTGYDVFVTREPCIMCAMAMVHCRVKRVFYGCAFRDGALGSKCKVHTRPALNHHYLTFKHVLHDECVRLLEKYEVG